MILPRTAGVFLEPDIPAVPYGTILSRWMRARFEPARCRAELEKIIAEFKLAPELFDPQAIASGGLFAREALLFPRAERWSFMITLEDEELSVKGGGTAERMGRTASEFVRSATQTEDLDAFRERWSGLITGKMMDRLCAPAKAAAPRWPQAREPGLYHREHASLLVRSNAASVLLDPICLAAGGLPMISRAPTNLGTERLDAIAITHSHGDHWHAPSILRYAASPELPVIVPEIARPNILAPEDLAATLGLIGQSGRAAPWGSTFTVGDMEIDVLPFFGEQPTRDAPGPNPALRNWGNCYRFNAPGFSALVLADSGADPAGSMIDEIRRSAARRGPVDAVLASVRQFAAPFFGGLERDFATLSFDRLRELFPLYEAGRLPSTTAGPEGIVEACAAAQARCFLPYANGFSGVGVEISDVGWGLGEPSETQMLERISSLMRERGVKTQVLSWNAGDAALLGPHGAELRRWQP